GRRERQAAAPAVRHAEGRGAGRQARRPADRSHHRRAQGARSRCRGDGAAFPARHDRSRRSGQGAADRAGWPLCSQRYEGHQVSEGMTASRAREVADDAPHLMIVEDDRRIRDSLSRFLVGEGYRVTTAMSAPDARAKLSGLHFDLLILDVMMPGENGFDLARSIRLTSNVPIIMLTARAEAESRIEGL